jgi:type IV secretion system protein TrbC
MHQAFTSRDLLLQILSLLQRRLNRARRRATLLATVCAFGASAAFAASPWERAVDALAISFTGPIAKGLALVAVVIGGVTFAFGEGDSKRLLAGIVFGIGMALGASQFIAWLFF